MPTSVVMPQMGESIAEGTIVRWNKNVGDTVDRDEPLFEISTDKVDAEIPSPVAGVLLKITAREGETVPVDSVVALIGAPGETLDDAPVAVPEPTVQTGPDGSAAPSPREADPHYPPQDVGEASAEIPTVAAGRRLRSSPLVRRIAKDQGVDVSFVPGSGSAGRVTKRDILAFIDRRASGAETRQPVGAPVSRIPAYQPGEPIEVKPLSVVRRKIAEHMVLSRRTSAHVHTVFHVDFSAVEAARAARRADFERAGVKVTSMAFIAQACATALRAHPLLNAALDGVTIVYKKDINLGVAVAIDGGLIVPVVRHADTLDLVGLSKAIADVAARA